MCRASLVCTEQSGLSIYDDDEVKGPRCSNACCRSLWLVVIRLQAQGFESGGTSAWNEIINQHGSNGHDES